MRKHDTPFFSTPADVKESLTSCKMKDKMYHLLHNNITGNIYLCLLLYYTMLHHCCEVKP